MGNFLIFSFKDEAKAFLNLLSLSGSLNHALTSTLKNDMYDHANCDAAYCVFQTFSTILLRENTSFVLIHVSRKAFKSRSCLWLYAQPLAAQPAAHPACCIAGCGAGWMEALVCHADLIELRLDMGAYGRLDELGVDLGEGLD